MKCEKVWPLAYAVFSHGDNIEVLSVSMFSSLYMCRNETLFYLR